MSAVQQYLDLYVEQQTLIEKGACGTLNVHRSEAHQKLLAQGLPTQRNEAYRYTPIEQVMAPDFGLNLARIPLKGNPQETFRCNIPNMDTEVFYVVNDTIAVQPTLLSTEGSEHAPLAAYIGRFADFEQWTSKTGEKGADILSKHYHRLASETYDGITELNTMLVQDALVIYLPENCRLQHTIQIVNVTRSRIDLMVNRRLLIIAEKNSQATILCCEETTTEHRSLSTQVTEIIAHENAQLQIYTLEQTGTQNTRFNQCYIEEWENAKVDYSEITLHNGTTRNTTVVRLKGKGAEANTYGAIIANQQQRVDNYILMDHTAEQCNSDMLYKYVLDEYSVGAFAGKVLVREGAQKTNSQQTNANLCTGPMAHAYAQPMLEIYADDVKCNHGSTIGKLDETALFYMQQRGVPENEARLLLQHAFVNDVLRRISLTPLRERLSHLVELRFRGQLRQCKGCQMECNCP